MHITPDKSSKRFLPYEIVSTNSTTSKNIEIQTNMVFYSDVF